MCTKMSKIISLLYLLTWTRFQFTGISSILYTSTTARVSAMFRIFACPLSRLIESSVTTRYWACAKLPFLPIFPFSVNYKIKTISYVVPYLGSLHTPSLTLVTVSFAHVKEHAQNCQPSQSFHSPWTRFLLKWDMITRMLYNLFRVITNIITKSGFSMCNSIGFHKRG